MSSKPINIPTRILSSTKPPQKNPFSPPNSFPKSFPNMVSSFDMYCGHLKNNEMLRKNWKNKVESFAGDEENKHKHQSVKE